MKPKMNQCSVTTMFVSIVFHTHVLYIGLERTMEVDIKSLCHIYVVCVMIKVLINGFIGITVFAASIFRQ